MERDELVHWKYALTTHFNSHAHVERDNSFGLYDSENSISTHTLTWSVTDMDISYVDYPAISTHTLTWSVTFW